MSRARSTAPAPAGSSCTSKVLPTTSRGIRACGQPATSVVNGKPCCPRHGAIARKRQAQAPPPPTPSWRQRPRVTVQLSGEDGNVYAIIGRCARACKRAGWPEEDVSAMREYLLAAPSYDGVQQRCFELFEVL